MEDVAAHRIGVAPSALPGLAQRAEPPAERAHHPPDMLAHHIVADADLAQSGVHVVNEGLGEQHRRRPPRVARFLQAEQDQGGQCRDHVEAAVQRVRHLAVAIP